MPNVLFLFLPIFQSPAKILSSFLRLRDPLHCSGMISNNGPLPAVIFKTLSQMLSQNENMTPATLRLSSNLDQAACLTVPAFLPINADSAISELTSAAGLGSGLTGSFVQSWPPVWMAYNFLS